MRESNILLVEDNIDDVELVMHELDRLDNSSTVKVVSSGEAALEYCFSSDEALADSKLKKPDLILLDLGLPGMGGLEVLKKIKSDESTKRIPVVVLTVSDDENDIIKSYNYGVNSFLSKPLDFSRFSFILEQLGIYWLSVNERSPH